MCCLRLATLAGVTGPVRQDGEAKVVAGGFCAILHKTWSRRTIETMSMNGAAEFGPYGRLRRN